MSILALEIQQQDGSLEPLPYNCARSMGDGVEPGYGKVVTLEVEDG